MTRFKLFLFRGKSVLWIQGKSDPTRPGRPGLDASMSRTLGWGVWSDGVLGMMVFPGVSQHVEFDFDRIRFARGDA